MAHPYLDQLTDFIDRLDLDVFSDAELEIKHFFSGAALYVDGQICLTLTPVGLALKLPEADRQTLREQHGATDLRYFPNAPIKKDYVVLSVPMMEDSDSLRHWISRTVAFIQSHSE